MKPPDVFLEEQLERAEYSLLSKGDESLPPALKTLPPEWEGLLAAYGESGGDGGDRFLLSVGFNPFQADLYAGDELVISANKR